MPVLMQNRQLDSSDIELDVLSRLSQVANYTLDVESILELIYAEVSRIFDTRNFYIAVADPKRTTMRFVFNIENNERLHSNDELPINTNLIGEIMRHGQAIVTDDYTRECAQRGLIASNKPSRAWMGVPLNVGSQPMGVMGIQTSAQKSVQI